MRRKILFQVNPGDTKLYPYEMKDVPKDATVEFVLNLCQEQHRISFNLHILDYTTEDGEPLALNDQCPATIKLINL